MDPSKAGWQQEGDLKRCTFTLTFDKSGQITLTSGEFSQTYSDREAALRDLGQVIEHGYEGDPSTSGGTGS